MALKINGTTVVDDSRNYTNIQSITFADATSQTTAGGTGGSVGTALYEGGDLIRTMTSPGLYGGYSGVEYGTSVAADGNYLIIAEDRQTDSSGTDSGTVYIYDIATGILLHRIRNPNAYSTSVDDFFGYFRSVAISGKYAIVGAYKEDDAGGSASGKAYIFNVTTGALLHTLDNPNAYSTSADDFFGWSVSISGNYAIVGAYLEDDAGGTDSGKAYIFNVTTGALLHTLDNPNAYGTSADDRFGYSVSISGNYAIVGAYRENDAGGADSGKAYIFNVTTGALVHTLDNPNAYSTSEFDRFGFSVAISGNYAIVGAYSEDDAGGTNSGKAYIFNVTTGALVHTLDNPNAYGTSGLDSFGYSVAISGNYAIIGAYRESDASGSDPGKAYIFNVTTGALVHTLDNPNAYGTGFADRFGYNVAISGNYAISVAIDEDPGAYLDGAVYVFAVDDILSATAIKEVNFTNDTSTSGLRELLTSASVQGQLIHTLDNPNYFGTSADDNFGYSVAISGNYAIVGASGEDNINSAYSVGAAYIFNVTSGELLHSIVSPTATTSGDDESFGHSVAISGNYAIIGAQWTDITGSFDSGKAYIFNVTTGALVHTLDNPNAYSTSQADYFGYSTSISGNYAIVAAYGEDDAGGTNSGKAYIFNVTTGALVHTLDNPNAYSTSADDGFGGSVAISGNYAIIGAQREDDATWSNNPGKAYIFDVATGDLVHTLDNPNAYDLGNSDEFGYSVAISGNYAIVGTYKEDDAGGTSSGKAYIFNVTTGALLHTLDNPSPYGTSANDYFGVSVAISGNYAIIGAYREDDAGGGSSGKAYIFNVTTGALLHILDNPNAYSTSNGDEFGTSVAIDGNNIIVGAIDEDDAGGSNSGKAYIFSATNQTHLDKLITMVS